MSKRSLAKLAPQITRPSENRGHEALEVLDLQTEQKDESPLAELDHEIECPRRIDITAIVIFMTQHDRENIEEQNHSVLPFPSPMTTESLGRLLQST